MNEKNIDIVCGGFFGDCGKGQICAHLVAEQMKRNTPYGFAVRVGGSNAEHRFETPDGKRHTGRVLPVAGWVDRDVKLVLGAGHIIKLDSLFKEMDVLRELWGADQSGRVFIDPQAGVIEPGHVEQGRSTAWRGSTHQGTGQAAAHKVLRDGNFRVAKDYPQLADFISKPGTVGLMREWMARGETGLLEGSQGVLLSLNHGYYPFCTSKDVTPAALLAEAGIPTGAVRHILAVYRTLPMRVPGNSGPTGGRELSWEEIEGALGRKIPEGAKRQTDSGNRERLFLWSWEDFERSVALIGPTHMALTFTDWWVRPVASVGVDALVRTMEEKARCPVVMIRSGPGWAEYTTGGHDNIWRG